MNTFQAHFDSLDTAQKEHLAQQAGTSVAYLYQIATGRRSAGAGLIDRLMNAGRKDIVVMLRPNWFDEEAA